MSKEELVGHSSSVLNALRAHLFGPAGGDEEIVAGKPYWRYLCGILFPYDVDTEALNESDEPDAEGEAGETGVEDPSVAMAYEMLPSSMGVSFYVTSASQLDVFVEAARYESEGERANNWKRVTLSGAGGEPVSLPFPALGSPAHEKVSLFDGCAEVHAVFRPRLAGHLVTVSLVNEQNVTGDGVDAQIKAMLFQCGFEIRLRDGAIGEYPSVERFANHEEDEELSLIYRERRTYGIGHGCTAVWETEGDTGPLRKIRAEALPTTEVKGLTTEIELSVEAKRCLSLQWLAKEETDRSVLEQSLTAFLAEYENWIDAQSSVAAQLDGTHEAPAARLMERQRLALERMSRGVKVVTSGEFPDVLDAFRIAQRAMLLQFAWGARKGDAPKDLGDGATTIVDVWSSEFENSPAWRPFQLAFQLLVIESLANPDSEDRDVLDLLWFPTGGGKTEAYLALTAFEIVHRRLKYGDAGAGTVAMMRYTLRLLTTQQFERSANLISALEVIRRTDGSVDLGEDPITLGLWVGPQTPNRLDSDNQNSPGAVQLYEQMLGDQFPENPFQLLACPCCGTDRSRGSSKEEHYGIRVNASSFSMFCPDDTVRHESIPVSVIDDDLYKRPPSLLLARSTSSPGWSGFQIRERFGKPKNRRLTPL